MPNMVWGSVKTVGATIVLFVGVIIFTIGLVATSACATELVENTTDSRECVPDSSQAAIAQFGIVGGVTLFVSGLVGVYRFAPTAGRLTNILIGGALLLFGGYLATIFGDMLVYTITESTLQTGTGGMVMFGTPALVGSILMIVGFRQVWIGIRDH